MKKEVREDSFIKQPFYQGGDKAMVSFIVKELKYPAESHKNQIEGSVFIKYNIDIKGNVTDAKIISGLDKYCNEEALRVVKLLKFVVPKNPRKLRITFHKTIRIHFDINETKVISEMNDIIDHPETQMTKSPQISYTIITNQKGTTHQFDHQKPQVFTYTIKLK